jgi:hypothetical protein
LVMVMRKAPAGTLGLGRSEVGRIGREEVEGAVTAHCAPGKGCPLRAKEGISKAFGVDEVEVRKVDGFGHGGGR